MFDSADLHTLRRDYTPGTILHEEPALCLFENFASAQEMAALQEAAFEQLCPAEVSGDQQGYLSAGRSGSNHHAVLMRQAADRGVRPKIAVNVV